MSQLVFVSLMREATFAFRDGIKAVDPNVTGTLSGRAFATCRTT